MRFPHIVQAMIRGQNHHRNQDFEACGLLSSEISDMQTSRNRGLRIFAFRVDTIRTAQHKQLVSYLAAARKRAGIRQTELAKRLGRSQTWVTRMESGGRRIDVIEFLALAELMNFNPTKIIRQLAKFESELLRK
jgi:DNA-binding XRE family transcriptional regulator